MVNALDYAAELQGRVRQNDLCAVETFEEDQINRSIVYTREDVVLLVGLATIIEMRLKSIVKILIVSLLLLIVLLLLFILFILRKEHLI